MDLSRVSTGLQKCLHGAAITQLEPLSAGWETDVYGFEADNRPLVLRVYSGFDQWNRGEVEARAMRLLNAQGYPVPRIVAAGPDPGDFGGWYLIMDRVPGQVFARHFGDQSAAPAQVRLFCSLLRRLHQVDPTDFGTNAPSSFSLDIIRLMAGDLREAFEPALQVLDRRELQVGRERRCLIHGDFHSENILITPDGAPFVIDWSGAALEDPRADVAQAMALCITNGNPGHAELIRQGYEAEHGGPLPHQDYFLQLALTRRVLTTVVTMVCGSAAMGMRPGLEVQLRKHGAWVQGMVAHLEQFSSVRLPLVHAAMDRVLSAQ
ncbi:MAG: putative aminoglycoside phosphotransferase [Symbiobacteriaceae bacterium]|jgi:aminoglycoside phosphotransferase (APT) family kinase protein|nr:putative aminoglycoside phosphotransferase [Symbiobacteriaceae bacterium]